MAVVVHYGTITNRHCNSSRLPLGEVGLIEALRLAEEMGSHSHVPGLDLSGPGLI